MISLVVTADSTKFDPSERDAAFAALLTEFKQPFEIVYVANADYEKLDALREVAKSDTNRRLVVTSTSTNINTQIYTALDHTNSGDCLLATLDTNLDLIKQVIKKHIDGADLVFVKQENNWFKSMFVALGHGTYQMGLKLLGRGRDMCCEPRVVLLNNRSVNTIILNPALSKALRLVNPDPERTARVVSSKKIFDEPDATQKNSNNSFLALGVVSLFYIIALLVMAVVFPICNSGVYTTWILIAIVLWIVLGVIGAVIAAKFTYNSRLGLPIAINLAGEPVINIVETVIDTVDEATENGKPSKTKTATKSKKTAQKEEDAEKTEEEQEIETTKKESNEEAENKTDELPQNKENIEEKTDDAANLEASPTEEKPIKEDKPKKTAAKKSSKTTSTKASTSKAKSTTTKTGAKKPEISKIKSTRGAKTKK